MESQARPNMLACATSSNASTGNSAIALPSNIIFIVPNLLFNAIGATKGSLRSSDGFNLAAEPFGKVTYRSRLNPILIWACFPFQISGVPIAWPFS